MHGGVKLLPILFLAVIVSSGCTSLDPQALALANPLIQSFLDEIIEVIRSSSDPKEAKARLIAEFELSEIQAQAILEMRLQRLTGLEREKINSEYEDLIKNIEKNISIEWDNDKLYHVIADLE